MKTKNKILLGIGCCFIVILIMLIVFHDTNVHVNITGIENRHTEIQIDYSWKTYSCEAVNKQETYVNGDQLEIMCTNVLFPFIRKSVDAQVDSLYSNGDDVNILLEQWKKRGIYNIAAILKKTDEASGLSTYYTIAQDQQGYKGYFDTSIVFNEKEKCYVQIIENGITEDIEEHSVVNIRDANETIASYQEKLGYELIDFKE